MTGFGPTYGSPTLYAEINFSDGPSFAPTFVLGESQLGEASLGTSNTVVVDVTNQVMGCSIRRTYSRPTDTWNTGYASLTIADLNGDFNPDNTSSPYYGKIKPMRKLTLGAILPGGNPVWITPPVPNPIIAPATVGLFRGYIQSWKYTPANGADVAKMEILAYDGFLLFNNSSVQTVTGTYAGELTGQRIDDILDQIGWPLSMEAIDTGRTTLQADPGTTRTTLNAIQQVEESEYGAFYMDRLGYATFKDRTSLAKALGEVPLNFSDTPTYPDPIPPILEYAGVTFGLDDTLIQNVALVTPSGMATQIAEDTTSIATYFTHSVNRDNLLMDSTTDAMNQAKTIVRARAFDELRIDTLTVNSSYTTHEYIQYVMLIEMLTKIRVVRTAPGGLIDQTLLVHGISHDVSPGRWVSTFQTLEPVIEGFILDNPYSGVLGTSTLGPY